MSLMLHLSGEIQAESVLAGSRQLRQNYGDARLSAVGALAVAVVWGMRPSYGARFKTVIFIFYSHSAFFI
jgi:hypothetical protein